MKGVKDGEQCSIKKGKKEAEEKGLRCVTGVRKGDMIRWGKEKELRGKRAEVTDSMSLKEENIPVKTCLEIQICSMKYRKWIYLTYSSLGLSQVLFFSFKRTCTY